MAALRQPPQLDKRKEAFQGASFAAASPRSRGTHKGWLGVVIAEESLDVAPRLEGRVESVRVQVGSMVRHGEVLVTLDARSLKEDLAMADAVLLSNKAELDLASLSVGQARERLKRRDAPEQLKLGAISEEELSAARYEQSMAEAKLLVARSKVQEQEVRVSQLQQQVAEASLRAPFDGVVAGRFVHPGALARAGLPVLHLMRQGKPQVRFAIPAEEMRSVSVGQAVSVAGRDLKLTGQVTQLAPQVDVSTLMVFALANLDVAEGHAVPAGTEVRVSAASDKPSLTVGP
nr:efflux RND transporter periplasmic adaptor subunit [Corallococcus carmarthensis]